MKTIEMIVRTVATYLLIGILGLIFIPPMMLLALLPARWRFDNRLLFFLINLFYKAVVKVTFLPLVITGNTSAPQEPVIFAANHQSALDIPVLGTLCHGKSHIWFALEYYAYTPILGFFIRRLFVPVDLSKKIKAARALIHLTDLIKNTRRHALIFPEGGRFTDDKIHPFYSGFAVMAKKSGHPVIPVYFANNARIYPPGSFWIYRYPIDIIIGEPLRPREDESTKQFCSRVHDWFVTQNEQWLRNHPELSQSKQDSQQHVDCCENTEQKHANQLKPNVEPKTVPGPTKTEQTEKHSEPVHDASDKILSEEQKVIQNTRRAEKENNKEQKKSKPQETQEVSTEETRKNNKDKA